MAEGQEATSIEAAPHPAAIAALPRLGQRLVQRAASLGDGTHHVLQLCKALAVADGEA